MKTGIKVDRHLFLSFLEEENVLGAFEANLKDAKGFASLEKYLDFVGSDFLLTIFKGTPWASALSGAFPWEHSAEGSEFWKEVDAKWGDRVASYELPAMSAN